MEAILGVIFFQDFSWECIKIIQFWLHHYIYLYFIIFYFIVLGLIIIFYQSLAWFSRILIFYQKTGLRILCKLSCRKTVTLTVDGTTLPTANFIAKLFEGNPTDISPQVSVLKYFTFLFSSEDFFSCTVNVLKFCTQSFWQNVLCKQCRPRSDCSWRSRLIRVYPVCPSTKCFKKQLHKKKKKKKKNRPKTLNKCLKYLDVYSICFAQLQNNLLKVISRNLCIKNRVCYI